MTDIWQVVEHFARGNSRQVPAPPPIHLELPATEEPWKHVALQSLAFVIKQWEMRFGELCHEIEFPRAIGHTAEQDKQYGDTFQRAIIADILCDANALVGSQLDPVIEYETDYLLSKRRLDSLGGWSYFPDLPELPPDADDLAQIMQVFLKSGRIDLLKEHCETPLKVLLSNMEDDGSFETWIIPQTGRSPAQERHAEWAAKAWGLGPDCEVIANALYAVALYDADRFRASLERGIDFVEAAQEEDGSWPSTWYFGPFYGLYVCLRLLTTARPNSPAIQAGLEFLRRTQHSDGGWGLSETNTSDALSTALALLGLATAWRENVQTRSEASDRERAQAALAYLVGSMEQENSWVGVPLIRMELGRARGVISEIKSYGGRTITTAYVLYAASVWHGIAAVERTP